MKHPRAPELTKIILAVKAAGEQVHGVRVRWVERDGREVPEWDILTAPQPEVVVDEVKW